MRKIANETLINVLTEMGYDMDDAQEVASRCQEAENAAADKKDKVERTAPEYVIMVNDPKGVLPDDLTGWVVRKHPAIRTETAEEVEPTEWGDLDLEARIEAWGKEISHSSRFKEWKFRCLGDYVEFGSKKLAKEFGLQFITKLPVYIAPVNPQLRYWEEKGERVTDTITSLN